MRITVVAHDADRNGCSLYLLSVLKQFSITASYDIEIAFGCDGEMRAEFAPLMPTTVLGPPKSGGALLRGLVERADVVLGHSIVSHRWLAGAGHIAIPVLSYVQELEYEIMSNEIPVILTNAARQRFVAGATCIADNLTRRHGVPTTDIDVVVSGIDTDVERQSVSEQKRQRLRREIGVEDGSPLFVCSGPVSWRKGPDLFVVVAARIRQLWRELGAAGEPHFLWFGRFDEPEISQRQYELQRLGFEGTFHLLPPRSTAADLFAAADVYALTSREEPFSRALLQALAVGTPVVAFDSGGATELAARGRGVTAVDFLDCETFAREAVRLVTDPRVLRDAKQDGRALAERYSVRSSAARLRAVIERVTHSNVSANPRHGSRLEGDIHALNSVEERRSEQFGFTDDFDLGER